MEEKMGWVIRLWARLFEDKRSDWEKKQERQFIEAVNKLKNYSVSERGGLSIDPEELHELVMNRRQELTHLVQPSSSNLTPHEHHFPSTAPTGLQLTPSTSVPKVDDFVEVVTWRRLTSGASLRYVCLESLTTKQYAVATADLFSEPVDHLFEGLAARVKRLQWLGDDQINMISDNARHPPQTIKADETYIQARVLLVWNANLV